MSSTVSEVGRVKALGIVAIAQIMLLCGAVSGHARAQSSLGLQLSQSVGIASAPSASASPSTRGSYPIAANDVISLTVYQEPDLSVKDATVDADGTISVPLIGSLHVLGLTSSQLRELITQKLADGYLKQPNVTVKVDRHQIYFIKGEVASPGGYALVDGLTVEKAIALAGGYTERAAKRDITIVREDANDQSLREAALSTPIRSGDVITIEESFF